MSVSLLSEAVQKLDLAGTATTARESAVAADISKQGLQEDVTKLNRLVRIGFTFEAQGLAVLRTHRREVDGVAEPYREIFRSAADCWWAITVQGLNPKTDPKLELGKKTKGTASQNHVYVSPSADLIDGILPARLALAFRLATCGLLGSSLAEVRLQLRRFDLELTTENDWLQQVVTHIAIAFVSLVRKDGGWSDVQSALDAMNGLRVAQAQFEDVYLDRLEGEHEQARQAVQLVGFYHLAQMVTSVGDYLSDGGSGSAETLLRLDRHRRQAVEAFGFAMEQQNNHFVDLLWGGTRELVRNSLWTHLEGLPESVRSFGQSLIEQDRPVFELWPSQQEALRRNLLDPYQRAIIVEMPTSAGKTLLAKFSIVQTKAFSSQGVVAYVVPTRALANQITFELRRDFSVLGYKVEQAVPAFEMDPTENAFLDAGIDVLVVTPEKLDLLIRVDHPSVRTLSLVVADEAHNLQDGLRGARLELLLGMLKRERRNTRFLLLSPFLPNGQELVTWLGDTRGLPPIQIHWQPSRKIVAGSKAAGRGGNRQLVLEALPSVDNAAVRPGTIIPIGGRDLVPVPLSKKSLTRATAIALAERGTVLILCWGPGTAMKRAREIAALRAPRPASTRLKAVCEFLVEESGVETSLVHCLLHGVAYHHAGLSQEARWLVERLISAGEVQIVCGTTTLAQGVNFPISTVIIESLRKGVDSRLSYSDFWNIAGRAGRTLVDTVGIVAFPSSSAAAQLEYVEFLRGEAKAISSQLAELLASVDKIGDRFDLAAIRNFPKLSSLLQFLAHAVRTADHGDVAEEMETILRSSLVYHQADGTQEEALERFVGLCRSYVNKLTKNTSRGMIAVADTTGFATPSVLFLAAKAGEQRELRDRSTWSPDALFGSDIEALRQKIAVIADVPEMKLGDGAGGQIDTARVASILRDWVSGASPAEMAERYSTSASGDDDEQDETDSELKLANFSRYLFSTLLGNASWGLGALGNVCLGTGRDDRTDASAYVPSMIFFGVRSVEALWLRMAGVPRIVAEGMGDLWKSQSKARPNSYTDVRNWINDLGEDEWRAVLPAKTRMSASSLRIVWRELMGLN
ncbi:DEAD/DEAH box helicase [Roseomonas xinghualingensis]|uniref:DEAD/DEAH box helicase n=1 Tax=Roseomonas xinghualingensis TaxID=2986475 RepID=UPI0021F1BC59|nr:DEAD/DEAH box helicase [Roseomonas sp. SXEYE001]MCV4209450.1 DEAD/DEAH box helicase [Roseomonas sp. SXEYE001]